MYQLQDPTRLVGRTVVVATVDGRRRAKVTAVGSGGITVQIRGRALTVPPDRTHRVVTALLDSAAAGSATEQPPAHRGTTKEGILS